MNRKALGSLILLVSLLAPAVLAQSTIRCESDFNHRKECSFSGFGRPALSHQLSRTACIEGQTWGRNGRNGVWVSNGCRADFVIVSRNDNNNDRYNNGNNNPGEIITCRSNGGRLSRCGANTRFGVQMNRQISASSCVEGRSWGYDADGIWVDRGCSAEFMLGTTGRGYRRNDSLYSRTVVCESDFSGRHNCAADTSGGIQLSRQLSRTNCILNKTWGYDSRGIWVSKGCRAEFLLGR
jgi:hypothetical protein